LAGRESEMVELGHLRGGGCRRRRLRATWLDSVDEEAQREEAVSIASSPVSGDSGNGGVQRRPWLGFAGAQRETERGKSTPGREEDRGEAGRQGILSPWRSFGGSGHLLGRSTAGAAPTQLLAAREEDDGDRIWAGP
jgi:hypothetical protein